MRNKSRKRRFLGAATLVIYRGETTNPIRIRLAPGSVGFLGVVTILLLSSLVWLAWFGINRLQSPDTLADRALLRDEQQASIGEAFRTLLPVAHEVEDLLYGISGALTDPIGTRDKPFHRRADASFFSTGPADTESIAEDTQELLRSGQRLLSEAREDALLRDRILREIPNVWPLIAGRGTVTLEFGPAIHPFTNTWYLHKGIDIADAVGVPLVSMADGVVREISRDTNNYGLHMYVDFGYGFSALYAHLDSVSVQEGDVVEAGTVIAELGATGLTTGPTLHLELFLGDELIDPAGFLAMGKPRGR